MRTSVQYGIVLGAVMSVLSWFANVWASVPGRVSVFPDLITLIALPVLVFAALRFFVHRQDTLTRATLRRSGMIIVAIGATVFALAFAVLGVVLLRPSGFLFHFVGFGMALIAFLLVGWLATWAAAMWLTPAGDRR